MRPPPPRRLPLPPPHRRLPLPPPHRRLPLPPPHRRLPLPPSHRRLPQISTLETQGEGGGEGARTMTLVNVSRTQGEGEGEGAWTMVGGGGRVEKKDMPCEIEILSHLPAKKLQSLKVVCKDWLQLISSPNFARLQLSRCNRSSNIRVLLAKLHFSGFTEYNNYCKKSIQRIAYPPQFSRSIKILGSADGLTYLFDGNSFISGIFNPSTQKCVVVQLCPPPPGSTNLYWFGSVGGGEYVLVMQFIFGNLREIWVYNKFSRSSSNTMNRICCTKLTGLSASHAVEQKGTFVQGVIYWPIRVYYGGRFTILAYHLGEKKYMEISSPAQSYLMSLGLFVDGCSLCATVKKGCSEFELLILKKDVGWTKYANIGFNNQLDFVKLCPLGFLPNGDLIIYGSAGGTWLIKYSFNDKESTFLLTKYGLPMDMVVMCADTLVSPSCC